MKKLGLALASLALAAASFASCALATGTPNAATSLSSSDLKSLQSSYMLSYYADSSGSPEGVSSIRALTPFSASASSGVAARTTVPVGLTSALTDMKFSDLLSTTKSISNYPEVGQTTSFSASHDDSMAIDVYLIAVVTSFPATESRASYTESYYVKDVEPNDTWTLADQIVADGSGVTESPSARAQMTLAYRDGSERDESIAEYYPYSSTDKLPYADLDINGTLDLTQISSGPVAAAGQTNVMFSSVVVYKCKPVKDSADFWFWKGHKGAGIIGVRYYTEYKDATNSRYVGRSASFEKIITDYGAYYLSAPDAIIGRVFNQNTGCLGEAIVRKEVQFALSGNSPVGSALSSQTRMKSRIADVTNNYDYILTQSDSDKVFFSGTTSSTIYQ